MALTTKAKLTAWAHPRLDGSRDEELERCITAAGRWIVGTTRRVIEEEEHTLYFNGDEDQYGDKHGIIDIPKRYSPIFHDGTSPIQIWEDDSALTVVEGYDTDADVLVEGANDHDKTCRLIRQYTSWSSGVQNIKAVFTAGYAADSIPAEIEQLANEVAWLFFKSPNWLGVSSESAAGHSKSFEKALTPQSADLVKAMREERW